ncbi:MAG TPA: hypothetical protein DDX39_05210 [Bacteroidales bacterium]|nr:MAG: hypothetical protein A2W98_10970 [Bacteroidetes bacterium GWF2_33_38]OFY76579.1 MAG: hypothetical protein A2265_11085 [Bacteroidetes bacterium RIFOXYA12_FULL_33_9]OFY90106.1 MAG: hypothetical protein A2236_01455 [Bacteroidetes bacterium RIFOXYA2_FULL_33_7]HBF88024.1 hypothetical protein [Bacteroidales bacterium]
MQKQKKILFYVSATVPRSAGDGKSAFNFANAIQNLGFKTTLLTLNKNRILHSKETIEDIDIVRIPYFNQTVFQKIYSRFIALPYFISNILKHDLVIIYGSVMSHRLLIILAKLFGKKIIFRSTLINYDDFNFLLNVNYISKIYRKFVYTRINGYFAINPSFSNIYIEFFGQNRMIFKSAQGVDINLFNDINLNNKKNLKNRLRISPDKTIIISIGMLIQRKGYREIFETLQSLNQDFQYLIIGHFEDTEDYFSKDIQAEMTELYNLGKEKLGDKICFLGPKENIAEYLQCADIFLHNSNQEGTPNVLLEAMACGIPSVVRSLDGIDNYIVKNGVDGFIFKNEFEMILQINDLISNSELRSKIGVNAQKYIQENFDINIVARKFVNQFIYNILEE